jgi:hypothetical protein
MRRGLLLLLIMALLALPLALALRDLSQAILTELMQLVWIVRVLMAGLPQETVWGFLLVAVLVAAVGSLFGWSQKPPELDRGSARVPGQVEELSRWIRRATEGRYFGWTLNQYLTNLTWEVMAYRERTTQRRYRRRVRTGESGLPPHILNFVESNSRLRPAPPSSLWRLLRRREPTRPMAGEAEAQAAPEEVIRFLEEQMEVKHDRGTG